MRIRFREDVILSILAFLALLLAGTVLFGQTTDKLLIAPEVQEQIAEDWQEWYSVDPAAARGVCGFGERVGDSIRVYEYRAIEDPAVCVGESGFVALFRFTPGEPPAPAIPRVLDAACKGLLTFRRFEFPIQMFGFVTHVEDGRPFVYSCLLSTTQA